MSESCCHAPERPAYLKKATLSALFALSYMILNALSLIPSPLSAIGSFIGLGLALLTAGIMKYSGGPYYKSAYDAFKAKKTNMNTLVALSSAIAFGYSLVLCLWPRLFSITDLHYHFSEIGMILGVVNLGRWQRFKAEDQIKKQTQSYINIFNKYQPTTAIRCRLEQGGLGVKIRLEAIEKNDILEIKPGERFPVEGVIVALSDNNPIWVDQKNITGESVAIQKNIGDKVLTGSLNKAGTLRIRASVRGSDNNLKQLLSIAQARHASKTPDSELINKITRYFIPAIIIIALITAGSWLWLAPIGSQTIPLMVQSVMSVLLCACPCALGLAFPMSTSVSIYKLLEKGILVKNASSFEKASSIDTLIFDKTGTLTEPVVDTLYFPNPAFPQALMVDHVASLEKCHTRSHPYANAILKKADLKKTDKRYCVQQPVTQEQGMTGLVDNIPMVVGSLTYCLKKGAIIDPQYIQQAQILNHKGQTTIFVVSHLKCVGVIGLEHQLNPHTKTQIDRLKAKGITIGLLTGDKAGPAHKIAQALGIDPKWVWCEQSAEQKGRLIKTLKQTRQGVAMVGDGMNDILACEEADIGFAMHAWTNAAVKCDVALQGSLEDIIKFLDISKVVTRNIKQNIGWTFAYNMIALIGATGLLYPIISCALNPILAAIFMGCSSLVVMMNAQRLPGLIDGVLARIGVDSKSSLPLKEITPILEKTDKSLLFRSRSFFKPHSAEHSVFKYKMVI